MLLINVPFCILIQDQQIENRYCTSSPKGAKIGEKNSVFVLFRRQNSVLDDRSFHTFQHNGAYQQPTITRRKNLLTEQN